MYVAVKLQSQIGPRKKNLAIDLYGKDIAEEKHKEWQEAIQKSTCGKMTTEAIDQVPPPDMNTTELKMKLTYIIIANSLARCEGVKDMEEVMCGKVYLAPYKKEGEEYHSYYRARVNSISTSGMVNVFFIDYGNVVKVAIGFLRVISVAMIRDFPEIVKISGPALGVQQDQEQQGVVGRGGGGEVQAAADAERWQCERQDIFSDQVWLRTQ